MKKNLQRFLSFYFVLALTATITHAQTLEWRLANPSFSTTDPDGAGPATGEATFTLQIHAFSGSVSNITGISTGWSWQSTAAMLPTGLVPALTCGSNSVPQPKNVEMSAAMKALGFTYNNVDQCSGNVNFAIGGRTFDRRAVGTVENGSLNLTTTWVDVFTVTLWATASASNAGYVVINSGAGGNIGVFSTYAVSDAETREYPVNSQTWTIPLLLAAGGPIPVPVLFTQFNAACSEAGTVVNWRTATEKNNSHFEVLKSADGVSWSTIGRVVSTPANGNDGKPYRFTDKAGGAALYRIKQVDTDGSTTYTDIVHTTCGSNPSFVSLYPVPAKDKLTLVIGSEKALRTTLHVVDNYGRVVMALPVVVNKGTNNLSVGVGHLAQGQYYLRGSKDGIDLNERFTISR